MEDGRGWMMLIVVFAIVLGVAQGVAIKSSLQTGRDQNGLDIFSMSQGVKEDARCVMCKFFVKKLHDYLKKSPIITMLNTTFKTECMKYVKIQMICDELLQFLDNEIMSLLDKDLIPDYACPAAGFCPKDRRSFNLMLANSEEEPNMVLCELCKYSAHHSAELVDQLLILGDVKNSLSDFCYQQIDAKTVHVCPEVVDSELMFLKTKLLEGALDPNTLCAADLYIC